jgi:hypothetical protein
MIHKHRYKCSNCNKKYLYEKSPIYYKKNEKQYPLCITCLAHGICVKLEYIGVILCQ